MFIFLIYDYEANLILISKLTKKTFNSKNVKIKVPYYIYIFYYTFIFFYIIK